MQELRYLLWGRVGWRESFEDNGFLFLKLHPSINNCVRVCINFFVNAVSRDGNHAIWGLFKK